MSLKLFIQSVVYRTCHNNCYEPVRLIGGVTFLFSLLTMVGGCTSRFDSSLERLPHLQDNAFKAKPYIRAAVALQAMGYDRACQRMMACAKRDSDAEQIYVLCRMLFTNGAPSNFRRPGMGAAIFIGDTDYTDWPLEPIELVDGTPFVIVLGYTLHGHEEPPESYLDYCMTNCDWSAFKFQVKSHDQLKSALDKLLASSKWKRQLKPEEYKLLANQIE